MLLREKLTVKITPPKFIHQPNEDNGMPISQRNIKEDSRVYTMIIAITFISIFFIIFTKPNHVRLEKIVKLVKENDENMYTVADQFDSITPANRFLELHVTFIKSETHRGALYDISMNITRNNGDNNLDPILLNFSSLPIQDGYSRLIFRDVVLNYHSAKVLFNITAKKLSPNTQIQFCWVYGNSSYTRKEYTVRVLLIVVNISMIILAISKNRPHTVEEWTTYILLFITIVYLNPFWGLRMKSLSRATVIIDRVLSHLYGAVLVFAIQAVLTLTHPWATEYLEGHAVMSWIFFVMTVFFDLVSYIISITTEVKISENPSLYYFQNIVAIIYAIYVASIGYHEYKTRSTIPNILKYRFNMIIYASGFIVVIYSVWKALSLFTNILSNTCFNDLFPLFLANSVSLIFVVLFLDRKSIPFNWFHKEDEKEKLE